VATGRFGEEALQETGADVVLRDLRETDAALDAILS
jgi:hypothetical protein